jgi:thiamine-monophosphate kinase
MPINKKYPSAEYRLLQKLRPLLNHKPGGRYGRGIGDDAAIRVSSPGEKLIITADTFVENVHFSLGYMTLAQAAYRAMAANLSDCAAMGAIPDGAMSQIVFPGSEQDAGKLIIGLYQGFNKALKKWNFPIIGGNLSRGEQWVFDITLIGRIPKGRRPLERVGVKNGDILWVTGTPGMSRAGLDILLKTRSAKMRKKFAALINKHIAPVPRINAGLALGSRKEIHAAIDVSDGVSRESHILSMENNLILELFSMPETGFGLMEEAAKFCKKPSWHDWFFNGGEDYELLFAADPSFDPRSLCQNAGVFCRPLGCFMGRGYGVYLYDQNGKREPLACGGWEHVGKS